MDAWKAIGDRTQHGLMELCHLGKVLEAGESHFSHSLCTNKWVLLLSECGGQCSGHFFPSPDVCGRSGKVFWLSQNLMNPIARLPLVHWSSELWNQTLSAH